MATTSTQAAEPIDETAGPSLDPPSASPAVPEPRSGASVFLLAFISFFVIFAAWGVSTPPFASPDEQYHISRASSVVRGQIIPPGNGAYGGGAGAVIESRGVAMAAASWRCVQHHLKRSAACAEDTPSNSSPIYVFSGAARYAPAYYAVIGWPTLIIFDGNVVIPMRLISAAWCAAMLAAALTTALQFGRRRWLALGVIAAVTPQIAFLGGTVNPNAVEICAAVLAWAAGLAIVSSSGPVRSSWLRRFSFGATSLVLMRQLSPLWLLGILAACVIIAGMPRLRELRSEARVYRWLALPFAGVCLQLAWVYGVGTGEIPTGAVKTAPTGFTLPTVLQLQPERWVDYFGNMGWRDITLPVALVVLWAVIWLGLAAVALRRTTVHGRWSLALVTVGILAVPVLLEWPLTGRLGYFWQGRYALPIAVGIPLVATACLSVAPRLRPPRLWLQRGIFVIIGFVGLWALTRAFMRYSSNFYHLSIFGPWQPPVPFLLLAAGFVAAIGVLAMLVISKRPLATPSTSEPVAPAR